jgi:hypothetical protein
LTGSLYRTSHTPASTPIAEGVYAITSTGRESHLAYQLTVPSSISEVQEELGLNTKGSFVCSVKNPDAPSPANASIGNPAKYPEEIQKKFRGLRWMPLEPELLNYEGAQMLIIGEAQGELGKAVEEQSKDEKDGEKEKPVEEMEKLGEEVCCCCFFFLSPSLHISYFICPCYSYRKYPLSHISISVTFTMKSNQH